MNAQENITTPTFEQLVKGSQFNLFGKYYEVYNTTQDAAHAIRIDSETGKKYPASKSNLKTITPEIFFLGIQTQNLKLL